MQEAVCGNCDYCIDGHCHRYPPIKDKDGFMVFPSVYQVSWCGEWKKEKEELE